MFPLLPHGPRIDLQTEKLEFYQIFEPVSVRSKLWVRYPRRDLSNFSEFSENLEDLVLK